MILTGLARLGRDAEVRYIPSGEAVASLALAFSHGKKGQDGNRETQWIDAALWGKQAESLAQYLTKGTLLSVVVGDPHIQTYDRTDGDQGFKIVGRVISVEFAGGGKSESQGNTQTAHNQQSRQPETAQTNKTADNFEDYSNDIPF